MAKQYCRISDLDMEKDGLMDGLKQLSRWFPKVAGMGGLGGAMLTKACLLSSVAIPLGIVPLSAAWATCGVDGNMLSNCGFETGNITGWTSGDPTGWAMSTGRSGSGNSAVYSYYGETDTGTVLSQTLATTVGTKYQITFSYKSDGGQAVRAYFGSTLVFEYTGAAQEWTDYNFRAQATASSTQLRFEVDAQGSPQYLDEAGVATCSNCNSNANTHTGAVVDTNKIGNAAYTTNDAAGSGSTITFDGGVLTSGGGETLGTVNSPKQVEILVWETGGTIDTSGGTVALGGTMTNLGRLKIEGGGTTTLSGSITNTTGTVVEIAGGTVTTLTDGGGTTVTGGSFVVSDGQLNVNREVNSEVNVESGGTLRGTGTISQASTISGTLRPGNSPGTLNFAAPVTQAGGSTLQLDVDGTGTANGAGNYSRVLITGLGSTYAIGSGATIAPELRGLTGSANNDYSPPIGQRFAGVVEAEGGVSGTFATVTQPGAGLLAGTRFVPVYHANSIDLYTTVASYANMGTAGLSQSRNQAALGGALEALEPTRNTTNKAVFDALAPLPSAALPKALSSISGEGNASLPQTSVGVGRSFGKTITGRLATLHGNTPIAQVASLDLANLHFSSDGDSYSGIMRDSGTMMAAAPDDSGVGGWAGWVRGFGAYTSNGGDGNNPGFHSITGGGVAGADLMVRPDLRFGLAVGYARSAVNGRDGSGEVTVDSYHLGPYMGWTSGQWYVDGEMGVTINSFQTSRDIQVGTLAATATAEGVGYDVGGQAEIGYNHSFSGYTLTPLASLRYDLADAGSYNETGAGALNLSVHDKRHQQVRTGLGARLTRTFELQDGLKAEPDVSLRWEHDVFDQSYATTQDLNGASFKVNSAKPGRDAAVIGTGISAILDNNLRLFAHYDADVRANQTSHTLTGGARVLW